MSETVFLDAPVLGEREKAMLCRAVDEGFVSTAGPFVPRFEEAIARRLGVANAAALQSGTAALELALSECGVGPGDEVVVPDLTFAATAHAAARLGAKVVLADVDSRSWTLDPDSVDRVSSSRTRAIVPVHLYGVPADMTRLATVASKAGAALVEDATEALDARWMDVPAGTIGAFGAFSFNGNKAITTGGGGALVGRDPAKVGHARVLANQARDESRGYFHNEIGCNYRMTNIEAALGLAQIEQLDSFQAIRRSHAAIYESELADVTGIVFQTIPDCAVASHWMNAVLLPPGRDPSDVGKVLASRGIQTRRLFHPLSDMPPWQGCAPERTSTAHRLHERGICLPSSARNSDGDVRRVCEELRMALK